MRYTQKRNGVNEIPLLNAVCGIDMPYWRIDRADDLHSYLSGDAADKLAAYEDTGLEPEEIDGVKALACLGLMRDVKRASAIMDAEREGRLMVLPCRVGDTVYITWASDIYPENPPAVREDHITQVKFTTKGYAFKTWRGWYYKSDIGKAVFLTRDDAETALKEMVTDSNQVKEK